MPAAPNPYDAVPYPRHPHKKTHPRLLEAVGTLFGMEPPPVTGCRVLELGCAAGDNLIPQAQDLPESRFLGIDLSERQMTAGVLNLQHGPEEKAVDRTAVPKLVDDLLESLRRSALLVG